MIPFGWKRKIGQRVNKESRPAPDEEEDGEEDSSDVDWLTGVPVKKTKLLLEDRTAKARRLEQEGTTLAEAERYWEAIKKWDEALSLQPDDAKLHEMKAQALMEVGEVLPAIQSAEKAVTCCATWWVARQTLGRAQMGLGEVGMAIKSFSKAIHLNPGEEELWREDLDWAVQLFKELKTSICQDRRPETAQSKAQDSACRELLQSARTIDVNKRRQKPD